MLQPSTKTRIYPTQSWGKWVVGLDGRIEPFPEGFSLLFFPFWMTLYSHGRVWVVVWEKPDSKASVGKLRQEI